LVPAGGQLPVLMMICGKELWGPLDRKIARQIANILAPFHESELTLSYELVRTRTLRMLLWNSHSCRRLRMPCLLRVGQQLT
jgi:hypothetical protein